MLKNLIAFQFQFDARAAKKIGQLFPGQRHRSVAARRRPLEMPFFEALEVKPEAVGIPFKYFDPVAAAVAEHE